MYNLLPFATKLQRLCFYRCLSVHRWGLPQCMLGHPPRNRHPPGTRTPRSRHPTQDLTSPEQVPPPPGAGTPPADSYGCGRYASYWNACLLIWQIGQPCSHADKASLNQGRCLALLRKSYHVRIYVKINTMLRFVVHGNYQLMNLILREKCSMKGEYISAITDAYQFIAI